MKKRPTAPAGAMSARGGSEMMVVILRGKLFRGWFECGKHLWGWFERGKLFTGMVRTWKAFMGMARTWKAFYRDGSNVESSREGFMGSFLGKVKFGSTNF